MTALAEKKILLAISGGIAAYKSADLARRLIEAGAQVRVVMTTSAQAFITPLTLQALTGEPVHTDLLDPAAEAAMGHIELARWADLILIAPASANTIARLAHGFASDLLSTLCLASEAPVAFAAAMNRQMWANPATAHNVNTLQARGMHLIGPGVGDQACGEVGAGRMLEPLEIRDAVLALLSQAAEDAAAHAQTAASLRSRHLLITAGPTREEIDPVRFLSNHSSGKMGFALAQAAVQAGARVTLIAGPVKLPTPAALKRIDVVSAKEMYDEVMAQCDTADIFISVAAVADYRVAEVAQQKIKKSDSEMSLQLARNPDILASVAKRPDAPFCVGFAAETQNVEQYARDKLRKKRLQMIAANQVAQADNAVFNSETNALEVFWTKNQSGDTGHASIPSASKLKVAQQLLALIAVQYARAEN